VLSSILIVARPYRLYIRCAIKFTLS